MIDYKIREPTYRQENAHFEHYSGPCSHLLDDGKKCYQKSKNIGIEGTCPLSMLDSKKLRNLPMPMCYERPVNVDALPKKKPVRL